MTKNLEIILTIRNNQQEKHGLIGEMLISDEFKFLETQLHAFIWFAVLFSVFTLQVP